MQRIDDVGGQVGVLQDAGTVSLIEPAFNTLGHFASEFFPGSIGLRRRMETLPFLSQTNEFIELCLWQ